MSSFRSVPFADKSLSASLGSKSQRFSYTSALLVVAAHGEIVFETLEAPHVTHVIVLASFLHRRYCPRLISCASGRPFRTLADRQTLRVCSDIVRAHFNINVVPPVDTAIARVYATVSLLRCWTHLFGLLRRHTCVGVRSGFGCFCDLP